MVKHYAHFLVIHESILLLIINHNSIALHHHLLQYQWNTEKQANIADI